MAEYVNGVVALAPPTLEVRHIFETCAEIIAKKMWHRADAGEARDLHELCAVADAEPKAIEQAAPFMRKRGATFLQRLQDNAELARADFAAIDAIGLPRDFDHCLGQARAIVEPLLRVPGPER
ncbi:MAG: hypothetical protein ACRD98_01915 [Nitrososphaera sp.]